MTFQELVNSLLRDTTNVSIPYFWPELAICATIVLMLFVRVFRFGQWIDTFYIALIGSAAAFYLTAPWEYLAHPDKVARIELFTGLLVFDNFTVFFRAILLAFAVLFVIFTKLSGIPDREDSADFYSLVLGATLGMCLMASANHLLMIFLAVEMASVPSYALAGMLKGRRQSSEAALKYSVYGAGASGVMLYGLSLLAGVLGSVHLPTMGLQLADILTTPEWSDRIVVLALGGLMVAVGLCFKLSAVPFHFWCPDVFEGAAAEVNAFLSVASKAAALALLVRVVVGFGYVPDIQPESTVAASAQPASLMSIPDNTPNSVDPQAALPTDIAAKEAALEPVRRYMGLMVAFLSAITCTFGNLAAYGQNNIKRLMAYSTIAHAGYMMMPVAAGILMAGRYPGAAETAFAAIAFYAGVYLFMNLGAFAIIAFLRNAIGSENINDYAGLVRRSPGVVICFSLILFSLIGLPPLAGFAGKLLIFASLVNAMHLGVSSPLMITLVVIGGLNTVISLFYYIRVVKIMTLEPEPEDRPRPGFSLVSLEGAYIVAITLPVVALGIWWNDLNRLAQAATAHLLS